MSGSGTDEVKSLNQIEIPSDWEMKALGQIFEFKNGINASKESYGTGVKFINVMQVIYHDCITANIIPGNVKIPDYKIKDFLVRRGDVLFNRTSETTDDIGLAAVYLDDERVVFGGFVIRGVPKDYFIFDDYKKYCFRSKFVRNQIIKGGQGAVRSNIGQEDLANVKLPLPPLPEQKAIAHILGLIDKAINLNNQIITQKELRKKWLMQQLLMGKKRLPGFEGECTEYDYNELLKVVKRPVLWNDQELYKLISVRRRSGGLFHRESLYGHQIKTKDLRTAYTGDFLFSKMQILHGASGLVTEEFNGMKISGSYIAVISKNPELLHMEFFNWIAKMPYFYHQTYISSFGVHIEKMTFDFESFLSLSLKLPSIKEQAAIVSVLQVADKEILLLKSKLAYLKEQKKGLMQVLLTGKKRLKINQ